ncbi:MAG: dihydrofolate reductase [Alphaproteobacteria bacterium]
MTRVAIWCRHKDDNIIGIGPQIPWHVPSDFKRFRRITEEENVVCGQTTYESFPNKTLPNRNIFVLTFDENYEVSDKDHHFVCNDYRELKKTEEDIYISGGASIYKLFFEKLPPEIVVDCVYQGDLKKLEGQPVDITYCVEELQTKYTKVLNDYEEDNILTSVYVKKGDFVPYEKIRNIINKIINS